MCKGFLPTLDSTSDRYGDIYGSFMELPPVATDVFNESVSQGKNLYSASTDLLPVSDLPSQLMILDKLSLINYQNILLALLFATLIKLLIPVI